jgi:hypothetical protein
MLPIREMKYNMSYFVLGISILAIGVLAAVPKIDVDSQINAAAYMGSDVSRHKSRRMHHSIRFWQYHLSF